MATKDENATTRARANILREFLQKPGKDNPFDHPEIKEVLDLCLSCKGCKSECPSNVDMAKYKAEFLQQYYDVHGAPMRSRLIADITSINKLGSIMPSVFNFFIQNPLISGWIKQILGFSTRRSIPSLYKTRFSSWMRSFKPVNSIKTRKVYLNKNSLRRIRLHC